MEVRLPSHPSPLGRKVEAGSLCCEPGSWKGHLGWGAGCPPWKPQAGSVPGTQLPLASPGSCSLAGRAHEALCPFIFHDGLTRALELLVGLLGSKHVHLCL